MLHCTQQHSIFYRLLPGSPSSIIVAKLHPYLLLSFKGLLLLDHVFVERVQRLSFTCYWKDQKERQHFFSPMRQPGFQPSNQPCLIYRWLLQYFPGCLRHFNFRARNTINFFCYQKMEGEAITRVWLDQMRQMSLIEHCLSIAMIASVMMRPSRDHYFRKSLNMAVLNAIDSFTIRINYNQPILRGLRSTLGTPYYLKAIASTDSTHCYSFSLVAYLMTKNLITLQLMITNFTTKN